MVSSLNIGVSWPLSLIVLYCKKNKICAGVNGKKCAWVKEPAAIDIDKLVVKTTNLYTKYKYTGKWDDETVDKDAVIVALANNLKKEQENENTAADRPGANGSRKERGDGPTDWKLINKGANMTSPDDGKKYVWFEHYGPNNGKSGKQNDMHMLDPHNHGELLENKKKKAEAWKDQQK